MRPGLIPGAPSFLEFCATLSPPLVLERGQIVAAKVAFDGVQPCDLGGEEREIARWLGCDDNPGAPVRWSVHQEPHKRYRLRPMVRVEILGPESEAGGQMVLR